MDATIIGEFVAMFVTAFALLFGWSYLQKQGYGIVRIFLYLIVSSLIIYFLTFVAYMLLLTDSALVFDTSMMAMTWFSSLGGAVAFVVLIRDKFQRD